MRARFVWLLINALCLLSACDSAFAQIPKAADSTVVLSLRIRVSAPVGGSVKTIEVAPRVQVGNGKEAQITVDTPDKNTIAIKLRPTVGPKGYVDIAMFITARLGGAEVTRKIKLVTLMGSPALIEIDDERQREKLFIQVTPTPAPPKK